MKVVKYIYVEVVKFPDFWKVFDVIYSILFLFSLLDPNLLPRSNLTLPVPLSSLTFNTTAGTQENWILAWVHLWLHLNPTL